MGVNRVFLSQETLDKWLSEERVDVDGETMTLKPDGQQFRLKTAVHFLREVAGGGDSNALLQKVKDLEQITALGGEHCADSVIIGDNAYEVVEGFVGEPIVDAEPDSVASGPDLAAATRAALGDQPQSGELDMLVHFFSSSRQSEKS